MTQSLVQGIIDALSGSVGKEAIVFIISMIPILELRGALLVAGTCIICWYSASGNRSMDRFTHCRTSRCEI